MALSPAASCRQHELLYVLGVTVEHLPWERFGTLMPRLGLALQGMLLGPIYTCLGLGFRRPIDQGKIRKSSLRLGTVGYLWDI